LDSFPRVPNGWIEYACIVVFSGNTVDAQKMVIKIMFVAANAEDTINRYGVIAHPYLK